MAIDKPVDISETGHKVLADNPDKARLNAGYKEIPFDFPAFLYVTRHLGPEDQGLLGWSMDVELLSRGKVTIKVSKNGPTDILVDGVKVHRIPRGN